MPSSNSIKKGKILFIPMNTSGHVNYCIALAKRFLEKYDRISDVYFAVNNEFKERLEKICSQVKFIVYDPPSLAELNDHWLVDMFEEFGKAWDEDAIKIVHNSVSTFQKSFNILKSSYPIITEIIKDLKPDFLIFDQLYTVPTGIDQNIPYANLFSAAMNYPGVCRKLPPPQSGLKTIYTPENLKEWEEFIAKAYEIGPFKKLKDSASTFLKEHNCPDLDDQYFTYRPSPYLNLYGYPKELDYTEFGIQLEGKWMRIDSPILKPYPEPYAIPDKLKNKPGKLIYFSLGSMAQVYKPLMTKMIDILSKLNHRFIISTGITGEQYSNMMSDNMHGEKYVNQLSVLQTVDCFISHGGNNSFTECFHFGTSLIILPLFGDQLDNGQRLQDLGLGVRCNIHAPSEVLKQQLEDAIDYVSKESIKIKMKKISERIQSSDSIDKVCDELLKYVKK